MIRIWIGLVVLPVFALEAQTPRLARSMQDGRTAMGFRRSPDQVVAAQNWRRFVERNATVVAASGLPPRVTASVAEWDDFLMHGFVSGDPGAFDVDQLSPAQYASLVEFAANYFAAGYEFYAPMALRVDDQAALRARFGGQ